MSVFVAPLSLEKIALSVLLIIMAPDALFVSIFFIFFIFYLFIYLFYFFVLLRTTHSLQLDQNYSILVFFIYKYFTDCNPADTCNGHGKCNGSGLCECNPGFIGNCHHCAENFYGPNCDVGMYFFLLSFINVLIILIKNVRQTQRVEEMEYVTMEQENVIVIQRTPVSPALVALNISMVPLASNVFLVCSMFQTS